MISLAFNRVVDAARALGLDVKDNGDRAMVQCPAHNDGRPSLSVRSIEGSVLLYCMAGCATNDVLKGLGLTPQDMFDDEKGFTYEYPGGRQVLRTPDKRFIQSGNKADTSLFHADRITGNGPIYVCFSPDTEVLTPSGWVPLPELPIGEKVAQYDAGRVEFVAPIARQQFYYSGEMVHVASAWSDVLVTPDHRMLTKWRGCHETTIRADELAQGRMLPVAGVSAGSNHVSEDDARLIAAWQADGVNCARGFRVGWNLKKPRKIERIKALLDACGLAWKEQEFPSTPGWVYITVDRRDHWALTSDWKTLSWEMLEWPEPARRAFLKEVAHWDGDSNGRSIRFFTGDRHAAEVLSALAAITGYGAILRVDHRPGRPDSYVVNLISKLWRVLGSDPVRVPYTGMVYCLTVPSSYLVTRRNGKVVVAGNCEGEKDVLAIESAGGQAVSAPGGANNDPAKFDWGPLQGKVVHIIADKDEPGRKRARAVYDHLSDIALSVGIFEALVGKDAADHIAAGKALAEFKPVVSPDILTFSQALDAWREWRESDSIKPIPTPWLSLNNKLAGGLHPGRLYVVGARTGNGKSVAGQNIVSYAVERGHPSFVVSVEMPVVEVVSRIIAAQARVDYGSITKRDFDACGVRIDQYIADNRHLPMYICDNPTLTIESVAQKCRALKHRGLALAFIDYAQLITASDRRVAREQQVAHIVRSAKVLAMELNIAIILAAQLNRNAEDESSGELRLPKKSDLRESGELEQSADVILLLHRHDERIYMAIAKNRTGPEGQVILTERFDQARLEA